MTRRTAFVIAVSIVVLAAVCWVWIRQRPESYELHRPAPPVPVARSTSVPVMETRNVQIDVAAISREQAAAEVSRRDAHDSKWEWKIPLNFYGKAIDENGQSVSGADVRFQWTNLSPKGTAERETKTDEQGLFSLDNVEGKRLVVRVTKPGYYSSDSRNQLSFEYANPFEEIYHQPSRDRPVLFRLRKQGSTADLQEKLIEIALPGDGSSTKVELETGKTGPDGELEVRAWKPWPPRPMSPPYDWKVTFNLVAGGFVETRGDFAFEAPEAGYEEKYTIEMIAASGAQWKVSAERTLYFAFGEPKRYGRLNVRTDGNSRYVFLDYVINPSGSRNLESDRSPR